MAMSLFSPPTYQNIQFRVPTGSSQLYIGHQSPRTPYLSTYPQHTSNRHFFNYPDTMGNPDEEPKASELLSPAGADTKRSRLSRLNPFSRRSSSASQSQPVSPLAEVSSYSASLSNSGAVPSNDNFDPPPAYEAQPSSPYNAPSPILSSPFDHPPSLSHQSSSHSVSSPNRLQRSLHSLANSLDVENKYAALKKADTVFLIDDSGSMGPWDRSKKSSWEEVRTCLEQIVPICTKYDQNGVDVYFMNHKSRRVGGVYPNITSSEKVLDLFTRARPGGQTPTTERLMDIINPYMKNFAEYMKDRQECLDRHGSLDRLRPCPKPLNVIVVTDGKPKNQRSLENYIKSVATQLDKLEARSRQVGVQFFQVGDDEDAKASLQALDDLKANNENEFRDMVDTATFDDRHRQELTKDGILKVVLGAMDKILDDRKQ